MSHSLRRLLHQLFPIIWAISSAFMAWEGLRIITGSRYPMMVVTSGSMEPALQRGDLILLWNRNGPISAGEIPVIWSPGKPLPMVHRAVSVHYRARTDGHIEQRILTKGDNNAIDDRFMYLPGRSYAPREDVVGLVWGYVPKLGWASLVLQGGLWR